MEPSLLHFRNWNFLLFPFMETSLLHLLWISLESTLGKMANVPTFALELSKWTIIRGQPKVGYWTGP